MIGNDMKWNIFKTCLLVLKPKAGQTLYTSVQENFDSVSKTVKAFHINFSRLGSLFTALIVTFYLVAKEGQCFPLHVVSFHLAKKTSFHTEVSTQTFSAQLTIL